MSLSNSNSADIASDVRRAVGLSLVVAGGAALCALAVYAVSQSAPDKIGLGHGISGAKVDDWLKRKAQSLQKGCDTIIESIEKKI